MERSLFALAITLVLSAWNQAESVGQVSATGAAKRALSVTPPISRAVLEGLRRHIVDGGTAHYGLSHYHNGSTYLWVNSHRSLIALKLEEAKAGGGRYTPPPGLRTDVVTVACGDEELASRANCLRVTVIGPDGRRVPARTYSAGPRVYTNALGARWTVRKVHATYDVGLLRQGFRVLYGDDSGTEWTFEVSAEDAREKLLLQMPERPPFNKEEWTAVAKARQAEEAAAARVSADREAALAAERKRQLAEAAAARCDSEAATSGSIEGCFPSRPVCRAAADRGRRLEGCPGVNLEFPATGGLPGAGEKARLVVACKAGVLTSTLLARMPVQAEGGVQEVGVSADGGASHPERWQVSKDLTELFAPDSIAFAGRVAGSTQVTIDVTPVGAPRTAIQFNVSTFTAHRALPHLQRLCAE
jgi:hypothetical protein